MAKTTRKAKQSAAEQMDTLRRVHENFRVAANDQNRHLRECLAHEQGERDEAVKNADNMREDLARTRCRLYDAERALTILQGQAQASEDRLTKELAEMTEACEQSRRLIASYQDVLANMVMSAMIDRATKG